ncbi:rna-directed dna polymerase from mobile element jockey-like [Pitangus sulphuratus]|nr:rna-directed dna polymerase from mobile element jockey-like [Pitangus sulphuratus]
MKEKMVTGNCQCELTKGKSYLNNLITFFANRMGFMEGPEGESRQLQACQPDLSARKGHGANHLAITQYQGIGSSQYEFGKGRSCLSNLISFYDKVTCLVDEGKAVDTVHLEFSKAFGTVSHSILLEKLSGLDGCTVHWVEGWLHGQAQRVVLNGVTPANGATQAGELVPHRTYILG